MSIFYYFAYGSNMLTTRLRSADRCPSARSLGMCELPGYELKWHKRSIDGTGKCDIVKSAHESAVVYGVMFEIDSEEKTALNRVEGLGRGYDQTELQVFQGEQSITVVTYIATNIDPTRKPLDSYHAYVVDGAVEHGLPAQYIAALKQVETIEAESLR